MNTINSLKDKAHLQKRKFKEITLNLERIVQGYEQLLEEMELTPEMIDTYANDEANFDSFEWEELQKEKHLVDEEMDFELKQVVDIHSKEKLLKEQSLVRPHWLFVR